MRTVLSLAITLLYGCDLWGGTRGGMPTDTPDSAEPAPPTEGEFQDVWVSKICGLLFECDVYRAKALFDDEAECEEFYTNSYFGRHIKDCDFNEAGAAECLLVITGLECGDKVDKVSKDACYEVYVGRGCDWANTP